MTAALCSIIMFALGMGLGRRRRKIPRMEIAAVSSERFSQDLMRLQAIGRSTRPTGHALAAARAAGILR